MNEPIDAEIAEQNLAMQKHEPAEPRQVTATQARIDAVADLTKTALAKAGTLQLTLDESKALLADFPDEDFQPGAAGKEHLLYIEHSALRNRFNSVLGLGQWAIIIRETWNEDFTTKGKPPMPGVRVYARGMLLVRGCYVAEAVGSMDYFPHNASQNYGDAFEGAKTAAFRRCAKEFGVGLQAWRKDFGEGWKNRKYAKMEQQQAEKFPPKPAPAKPNGGNGDKPLAERINSLALWLHGQLGVDDAKMVVPYLQTHSADGSDRSTALMPNEDLSGLTETSLDGIRKNTKGFIERVRAFAKLMDQIPGVEVSNKPATAAGVLEAVDIKKGNTNGKTWQLYTIKIAATIYTTFSKTVGEAASKIIGQYVELTYEANGSKGNTVTAITHNGVTIKAGESKA